jgi:hypothetical protein
MQEKFKIKLIMKNFTIYNRIYEFFKLIKN